MNDSLKILFVASEVAPFAKTGGLADVAGSLPRALAAAGHDVRVAMPCYQQIKGAGYVTDLPVPMDGGMETAVVREASLPGAEDLPRIPVYFVDNYKFFYREGLYCYQDDHARFHFFCKAALSMLPRLDFRPDIIHCNDWQTALIPLFLEAKYDGDPFYQQIATVFTIHNLQYQGHFAKEILHFLGLGDEYFSPEALEFYGQVNYMKAGLIYADLLNTVSRKYAQEIQTPQYGEGLDGLLRKRGHDLYGILNGIDYREFNPATDPNLIAHYDARHPEGKQANKRALQEEMDLPLADVPVIGIISRLVNQKGLDLIQNIMDRLLAADMQLIILGSGEDHYQQYFTNLKLRHRQKIGVKIGFDAQLAQRIYAGSDLFLMPSRFEPCGLGQLISMRYGTIPVVRATGGLEDTVADFTANPRQGNGFSFQEYHPDALWQTIQRALAAYSDSEAWAQLVRRAMEQDFSWSASAEKYIDLYRRAMQRHRVRQTRVG